MSALNLLDISYTVALGDLCLTSRERRFLWSEIGTVRRPRRKKNGRRRGAASGPLSFQISIDVARAMHWDVCDDWSENKRASELASLSRVLGGVFPPSKEHKFPYYVQGCHDLGGVLLLTLGEQRAEMGLRALVQGPLRGAVQKGMDVPCALLGLLPRLLEVGHKGVAAALKAASPHKDSLPHYALPWLLTWFSHSVKSLAVVQRLFDTFLLGHPLLPLYVSAALVTLPQASPELLKILAGASGDEGMIFQSLAALPEVRLRDESAATLVLRHCNTIYAALPPGKLLKDSPTERDGIEDGPLAVLKSEWPELWTWIPPAMKDPRLPEGVESRLGRGVSKTKSDDIPFWYWGAAVGVVALALTIAWVQDGRRK